MRTFGNNARNLGFRGRSRGVFAASLLAALMIICPIGRTAGRPNAQASGPATVIAEELAPSSSRVLPAPAFQDVPNRHDVDEARLDSSRQALDGGVYHTSLQ